MRFKFGFPGSRRPSGQHNGRINHNNLAPYPDYAAQKSPTPTLQTLAHINLFENLLNQPESDCIYPFPIDLDLNGRQFGSKSI